MAIDGVSGRTSYIGSGILNLRSQLDTLTEQLSSGKVSNTYAGQGDGRSLAIGLRSQLGKLDGYSDTAINVNTRINVANLSLQRLVDINSTVKGAAVSAGATIDNTGQTAGQKTAGLSLLDSVDMLNAQVGDRYLFSGRATDTAPVTPADVILNGNGAAVDGLKQVIAERASADLGSNGMGRLVIPAQPTPTSIQIGEDFAADPTATPPVPASVFGLKLGAISTTIAGVHPTQPTATPPAATPPSPLAMSIDLGLTNPKDGDQVKLTFNLPDGTSEDIVLTASSAIPTPSGSFAIDPGNPQAVPPVAPSSAVTAANLQAALVGDGTPANPGAIKLLANGALAAASAVTAGNNFFDEPPKRVSGTPLGTATSLVPDTTHTVIWYNGEKDSPSDPARGSAAAQVDQNSTVRYGARADEQALRSQLQTVAVFAAVTTSLTEVNPAGKIAALNQRIANNLASVPGTQSIQDIQADFAGAQAAVKATTDRQAQTKTISQTLLDSIEGVNNDEIATKILALQTSLQASYQTTSQLYQMSLVKFL